MSTDKFKERERALEDEYFLRKEKELIEKMRQRTAAETARQEMAAATGIADDAILTDLQELGFTRETVGLLHLVPLVQVAWADGAVQHNEREQITKIARLRGIAEGSQSDTELDAMLKTRPSEEFFERAMRVVRAMLKTLPAVEEEDSRRDLVAYCINIASASGGILGIGNKVSDAEKAAITSIARELETRRESAVKAVLQ